MIENRSLNEVLTPIIKRAVQRYPRIDHAVERARTHARRMTRPAWLGTLRRTAPLSTVYGFDRGTPLGRYYVQRFLEEHSCDIHGRVLEIKDSACADRFGSSVERCDVLDINPNNPAATIVADLATGDLIPAEAFDCFLLLNTLQYIYDVHAAVIQSYRLLRPGGVLLAMVPSVARVDTGNGTNTAFLTDNWRFTTASCSRLFGDVFGEHHVTVRSFGNVLTCMASLTGMAYEELSREELDAHDEFFPLTIAVRAIK